MATVADISEIARTYLRDFPKFFQTSFAPAGRTYQLDKPNIDPDTLWVAFSPEAGGGTASVATYELDERNGLIRLTDIPEDVVILVEGYHYEWVTPRDLTFYSNMAVELMTHNLKTPLSTMAPAIVDVIGIYALVQALWALLTEYSRDIDVIAGESVHILASQRYRMIESLLSMWSTEYEKKARALNIGLDRVEMLNLRRISRTTGKYVPVYKGREIGDYGPIERLWPPIDDGFLDLDEAGDDLRQDTFIDGDPPPGTVIQGFY